MPEWACVNGVFSPADEATVSINDRGLVFGDAVYEVFHAHDGRLWAAEAHYRRLEHSLSAVGIETDLTQVRAWVDETLERSGLSEALVYLQITRGVAPRRHVPPAGIKPTVIVTVGPLVPLPADLRARGARVITAPEIRWARRDIKSTNLLAAVLAKREATDRGAFEALFVEIDGTVNEGSSTNVFLVKRRAVITPKKGTHILPGVTRDLVLELARELKLDASERRVSVEELFDAEEVFLSGTTTDVLGVVEIDGRTIGDGGVGPITRQLYDRYVARMHDG